MGIAMTETTDPQVRDTATPHVGILEYGESEIRLWELPFTIGRSSSNTLTLRDEHISRTHCSIDASERGYQVRNHSSRNAVRVNGHVIEGPFLLQAGDRIEISKHLFVFRIVDREGNPVLQDSRAIPIAVAELIKRRPSAPEVFVEPEDAADEPAAVPAGGVAAAATRQPEALELQAPAPAPQHLVATPAAPAGVTGQPSPRVTRAPRPVASPFQGAGLQAGQTPWPAWAIGGGLVLLVLAVGSGLLIRQHLAAEAELAAFRSVHQALEAMRLAHEESLLLRRREQSELRVFLDRMRQGLRQQHVGRGNATHLDSDPGRETPGNRPPVSEKPSVPDREPEPIPNPVPASAEATQQPPLVDHVAGPAYPAGVRGMPFFGLTIAEPRFVVVIDASARIAPASDLVRQQLQTSTSALEAPQAFSILLAGEELRAFSNSLLTVDARYRGLASRFVTQLAPTGQATLTDALRKGLAMERLAAIAVVLAAPLQSEEADLLRQAIDRALTGQGPAVYLADATALAGAPAHPLVAELLTRARGQRGR
jgi:pSer/pThr/pTyr-binding forkhead associated (FHA) protein